MTHLTVEDAGSVRRNIFQFIHHRVKGDLAWCLLVNNGHPELFLKFIWNNLVKPSLSSASSSSSSPGIAELVAKLFQLFIHPRKSDKVFIIVQMHLNYNYPFSIAIIIERGPSTQCSCGPQGVQHRCPCSTWKLQLWYSLHLQYSWLGWCWYLMMGDNLLPNDSLLLIRGVTILTALLHLLLLLRSCPIMDNVHDSS